MHQADEPVRGKKEPQPEPSRSEEALRIIQGYVDDLREVIKKLRRKLN
jgi:hypothetical protein